MKNLVKNSENVLLTVVTLCAMYFLGSMLVHLFQSLLTSGIDGQSGLFSLAGIGAITLKDAKGAEDAKKKAVPFTVSEGMTSGKTSEPKPAYILTFATSQECYNFLDLGKVAGIKAFRWYSKDVKEGANVSFVAGVMKEVYSDQFISHYHKMTFKNAQEMKAANSLLKAKDRLEAKQAKQDSKRTTKVGNASGIIGAKIAAFNDLFAAGVITKDQLVDLIGKVQL